MTFVIENGTTYLVILGLAIACIFIPYIRKVAEWFITIVHEMGHGIFALLLGGGIGAIKLHPDGSGSTATYQRRGLFAKPINRIVLFAGYSFPIYLGASLILTAMAGNTLYGTVALIAMGILTFIFLRNWFGFLIIIIYGGMLALFYAFPTYLGEEKLILFLGFFFVVRGIYDIIVVANSVFRTHEEEGQSDFHILAADSWFPAQVWYILFVTIQVVFICYALLALNIKITLA